MNKGIIFGTVHYWDGNPYKGALVTLRYIKSNLNHMKICTTGQPKIFMISHQKTDANGEFQLPFYWEGHEIGEKFNSAVFKVSAITPNGARGSSASKSGHLSIGHDWSRLVAMIPSGLMSKGKSKLINGAAKRKFKNMPGNYSGLASIESLFTAQDPKKHASTENQKAVGSCEMRI